MRKAILKTNLVAYFCRVNQNEIFSINSEQVFNEHALATFKHQAENCAVYKSYLYHLGVLPETVIQVADIPYLPISFFKTHQVTSDNSEPEIIFSSSGTTGTIQSQHLVIAVKVYEDSFNTAFEQFYGNIKDTCLLALLPSYLERDGSSLIYMVDALLKQSNHPNSGYFLHNQLELFNTLQQLKSAKQKAILIGVTYALLDFLEEYQLSFPELIVMETGGMKGKRKEMVREELHDILNAGFGVTAIHSEYGMTELLSQAYSSGNGIFNCPSWMKIVLREANDPLSLVKNQQTGGINVIDLANVNSCSFIATQDLGRLYADGSFEVLGRFDHADIRGCNLLVQ
ncbi:phenylacetate-coenzyme A ligase PaaK-like adenylate-forming protein [Pedobacter sp. CG_S7]|uniref:LuxE/PaaK family acyltransferase n=1 Tax=Pedobacter sp. CG_S7 TaxID=3143930 RepID=UPI003399FB5E